MKNLKLSVIVGISCSILLGLWIFAAPTTKVSQSEDRGAMESSVDPIGSHRYHQLPIFKSDGNEPLVNDEGLASDDLYVSTDPTGVPPPPPPPQVVPPTPKNPEVELLLASATTADRVYEIMTTAACKCDGYPCVLGINQLGLAALNRTGDALKVSPDRLRAFNDCVSQLNL